MFTTKLKVPVSLPVRLILQHNKRKRRTFVANFVVTTEVFNASIGIRKIAQLHELDLRTALLVLVILTRSKSNKQHLFSSC